VQIQAREALDPEVVALIMAQQRELSESGVFTGPGDERYLVAVVGGHAVGYAAWHPTEDGVELQGLYVRPSFRGRDVDAALTMALEAQAPART
jgi:putative acetyltransferase